MKVINIQQAKTHLSRLVEQAMAGEEIVIAKAGHPCVQLTPCVPESKPRVLGGWQGKLRIAPDFDAPDPVVIELFEGRSAAKARPKQRKVKKVKKVK